MGAIADLLKSERGIVMLALIIAATVLTGMGVIAADQWSDYTKWVFAIYVGGKTITGAVALAKSTPKDTDPVSNLPKPVKGSL